MDIYSAGEPAIAHVTSERFIQDLHALAPSFEIIYGGSTKKLEALMPILDSIITPDSLILLQGAGDVSSIAATLTII